MRKVPVDVHLCARQVLNVRQAPAVCSAAKPPERCELKRRLAYAVPAGRILPDGRQEALQPAPHVAAALQCGGSRQHDRRDGRVHLVAHGRPTLRVQHAQKHGDKGNEAEQRPVVGPPLQLVLPLAVDYAQDEPVRLCRRCRAGGRVGGTATTTRAEDCCS